jgi:hypothetical protein
MVSVGAGSSLIGSREPVHAAFYSDEEDRVPAGIALPVFGKERARPIDLELPVHVLWRELLSQGSASYGLTNLAYGLSFHSVTRANPMSVALCFHTPRPHNPKT